MSEGHPLMTETTSPTDFGWKKFVDEDPPRDGSLILLWSPMWEMTWGVQAGRYHGDAWECSEGTAVEGETDDDGYDIGPTHWAHIPPTPEDDS